MAPGAKDDKAIGKAERMAEMKAAVAEREVIRRGRSIRSKTSDQLRDAKEKFRPVDFWREYITKCSECGLVEKHKSGFLFTCMNPEGVMLTFCNVNCCTKWEETGDNTNSRREAIKAQKAKKNGL